MTLDRQRGCLIGLAVGDALGAAVEFKSPGSFEPVTCFRAGGPHRLGPGEWTDDTSMALALADSIGQGDWDLDDQARRYVSWWRDGKYSVNGRCFDIGNTTVDALSRFQQHEDAKASGSPSSRASGNGSIMRLAPVPIRFADHFPDQVEQLAQLAAESSLPTHASPQCLSACRYFAIVLAGLIHGLERDEVLSPTWEPLQKLRAREPLHPEVDAVASGSFRDLKPPAIKGSGYVVKSLEAALWAFRDAQDFREAVLKAVNLGDDADTTGAVCGQLAGAFWGESGIPESWLEGLAKREMIEKALAGLLGDPADVPSGQQPEGAAKSSLVIPSPAAIDVEKLPDRPNFLTSNAANKAENEALVDQVLELATCGDIGGLRAMRLPPSPKLKAWHAKLVGEIERQLSATPSNQPPTASSYWVIPGRLLAGAYPGAANPEDHRKKVNDLVTAGVRVFISLMETDETNHAGDPFVPYVDQVQSLQPDATCIRFPVKDLSVPTVDQMKATLDTIDGHLSANRTVYIHCWGGVGRTGTAVACWLLRHGLASPDNVLSKLGYLRQQDKERGYRSSPETSAQRDFVLSWPESGSSPQPIAKASDEAAPTENEVTIDFQPTPTAEQVLRELLDRHDWMNGFKEGPAGKNQLTDTESALWAATYELRRLLGSIDSKEDGERLAKLWDLLVDGVLRSMVLARGGNDWVIDEPGRGSR